MAKDNVLLAPSILAADLANLHRALDQCAEGGADLVHVDVMDGHFVPNLTFGAPVLAALSRASDLPMDVHLMVSDPDRLLDDYVEAGASWVSVHWETTPHLDRTIEYLKERGVDAGVVLNPATPVSVLDDILPRLDFVLLMSVNPGFAGQPFVPYVLDKARRLRRRIDECGLEVTIEMDGGIGPENIAEVVASGVDACVAGSAIFGTADPVGTMRRLRRRAAGGEP
ncbi:MAG: ribulose-phosphate 3-epimerase [Thermoanaerobaculia bacterium]|nr:ribulose-phosphate 3-epimerase [Thermoanaerobaculia bacterium]